MMRLDIDQVWEEFNALAGPVLAAEDDSQEHIRSACRADRAWLFGDADSFLVLQYQLRPATSRMELLIWLFVSRGAQGCIERHSGWLRELAQTLGASRVLFRTRRRGFERALPRGWAVDHVTWSLEI